MSRIGEQATKSGFDYVPPHYTGGYTLETNGPNGVRMESFKQIDEANVSTYYNNNRNIVANRAHFDTSQNSIYEASDFDRIVNQLQSGSYSFSIDTGASVTSTTAAPTPAQGEQVLDQVKNANIEKTEHLQKQIDLIKSQIEDFKVLADNNNAEIQQHQKRQKIAENAKPKEIFKIQEDIVLDEPGFEEKPIDPSLPEDIQEELKSARAAKRARYETERQEKIKKIAAGRERLENAMNDLFLAIEQQGNASDPNKQAELARYKALATEAARIEGGADAIAASIEAVSSNAKHERAIQASILQKKLEETNKYHEMAQKQTALLTELQQELTELREAHSKATTPSFHNPHERFSGLTGSADSIRPISVNTGASQIRTSGVKSAPQQRSQLDLKNLQDRFNKLGKPGKVAFDSIGRAIQNNPNYQQLKITPDDYPIEYRLQAAETWDRVFQEHQHPNIETAKAREIYDGFIKGAPVDFHPQDIYAINVLNRPIETVYDGGLPAHIKRNTITAMNMGGAHYSRF